MRLLPRVRGKMVPQRGPLPEPLPTDAAGVRPLVRVRPHVILQVPPAKEAPPAQLAQVAPVARVVPLVQLELGPVAEGLSTRVAAERRGSAGSCRQVEQLLLQRGVAGRPGEPGTIRATWLSPVLTLTYHVN